MTTPIPWWTAAGGHGYVAPRPSRGDQVADVSTGLSVNAIPIHAQVGTGDVGELDAIPIASDLPDIRLNIDEAEEHAAELNQAIADLRANQKAARS